MSEKVTFWFDVACPFCWQTSRWIEEAGKVRDITVDWVPMSLAVLNEDKDVPDDYRAKTQAMWAPARVFAKVKHDLPEKVDELYTIMGNKVHHEKRVDQKSDKPFSEVISESLEEAGVPAEYAKFAETTEADELVRTYHATAIDAVGNDVGTPVMEIAGTAFFGPVITRVPQGEEAGKLFDGAVALASYPYFFELKRTRTEAPQV